MASWSCFGEIRGFFLGSTVAPCGACRQVMVETEQRSGIPMRIICQGHTGPVFVFNGIEALLANSMVYKDGKWSMALTMEEADSLGVPPSLYNQYQKQIEELNK